MKTRNFVLLPRSQKIVTVLGENIKLARLRRKYSTQQVAERANISRPTLVSIEKGNPNVTIGAYVKVLSVLGLENDILNVATDDKLGRRLQDAKLIVKERAPKKFINNILQIDKQVTKTITTGQTTKKLNKTDGNKK